jgi:hypothetical protein
MKPYDDPNCRCHEIEAGINRDYPNANWNCDEACSAWRERSAELKDNGIEFEDYADACYSCTCPTCGRIVCGWCV